jgi:hypothetical protein
MEEQGQPTLPEHPSSTTAICEVRFARSLAFSVVFCRSLFVSLAMVLFVFLAMVLFVFLAMILFVLLAMVLFVPLAMILFVLL